MRLRLIQDLQALRDLKGEWLRLWAMAPRPEIFSHPSWALLFLETYGAGRGIHGIVAEDRDGTVRGLLPMFKDVYGLLRFIGDPRSDYSDALCAPQDAAQIIPLLLSAISDPSALRLHALPEHSLLLRGLSNHGRSVWTVEREEPCPAILFDPLGHVSRDLLKKDSLRRHEKKVSQLGPIRLEKLWTPTAAFEALPILFDQHVARWRVTKTPSLFEQSEHRKFYLNLIADSDLWPFVDFRLLYAGDRVVAAHFGFMTQHRFLWYKPTFDPNLAPLGPGEVLLKHLIEATVAEQAIEFDFTRGNEAFKLRFANAMRWNYFVYRPNLVHRIRSIARTSNALVKRFLFKKCSPLKEHQIREQ